MVILASELIALPPLFDVGSVMLKVPPLMVMSPSLLIPLQYEGSYPEPEVSRTVPPDEVMVKTPPEILV